MFYKNARILTGDFEFKMGAFEVVDGKFGAILPENVSASLRKGECGEVAIVMNFNTESKTISLEYPVTDLESGEKTTHIMLAPYQVRFLRKETI